MIKALLILLAATALGLVFALSRLDTVTAQRDIAQGAADQAEARVASLRGTVRLLREVATDQAAIESTYIEDKQRAEADAENLRRCLANGTCGLRVAATCPVVRVGGAGAAAGEPDAGTPELTAAARRAYPALVAGLASQRAQIVGLQDELRLLHGKCMIGVMQ